GKDLAILSREGFVSMWVGETAPKTTNLLKENLGRAVFIDEAYSLINGERDSHGSEAVTALNRFMSEHPDEIVVIFGGYREKMRQTIFHVQPGLESRCTWIFDIAGYTPEEM